MGTSVVSRAHGRVNLIGEHTDYNCGFVLPTAIPQYTEVKIHKRDDNTVEFFSSGDRYYSYQLGEENISNSWVDYLLGGIKILRDIGYKLSGFSAEITSTIPEGSGLSSSAALEMSFLTGLKNLYGLEIGPQDLARIGQRIENEFVGARVGIMDQMATSLAQSGEALFLDTLNLNYESVPLPLDKMDLMVINSGISHRLSDTDGGYNERRAQCEEACRKLDIRSLREISFARLPLITLPEILLKRVRHVVTENQRVKDAVVALKNKDPETLGKLFIESHKSMRDDYQVSIPEIDFLVELCLNESDCYGARLTGGGFGGSIVAITKKGQKEKIAQKIIRAYEDKTHEKGTLLV